MINRFSTNRSIKILWSTESVVQMVLADKMKMLSFESVHLFLSWWKWSIEIYWNKNYSDHFILYPKTHISHMNDLEQIFKLDGVN